MSNLEYYIESPLHSSRNKYFNIYIDQGAIIQKNSEQQLIKLTIYLHHSRSRLVD